MKRLKFAAVDIGSNAVRLLIMSISSETDAELFGKEIMIRVPLRLGQESFVTGKIGDAKKKQLIRLLKAFRHLMKVYEVNDYRICATAALREAKNAKEIVKAIKNETDFKVEIIDGQEEANIIFESHFAYHLNDHLNYVFLDVGGGSTEISLISSMKFIQSSSYKIGTVRKLFNKVDEQEYAKLHDDLEKLKKQYQVNDIIGTGGNIIKLNTLAEVRRGRKLSVAALETLNEKLKQYSTEERIEMYKLKPDRADIITHAADIYLDVAKTLGARSFIVPKTGLIDGIIHLLYVKWKLKSSNDPDQLTELLDNEVTKPK